MKRLFWPVLLLVTVAGLVGCDGRIRMLHLQPPGAMRPPWGVASVTIPIEGAEDIIGIVGKVAHNLGLSPDPKDSARWWISLSDRDKFIISIRKEVEGYWTVTLADWPTTK